MSMIVARLSVPLLHRAPRCFTQPYRSSLTEALFYSPAATRLKPDAVRPSSPSRLTA